MAEGSPDASTGEAGADEEAEGSPEGSGTIEDEADGEDSGEGEGEVTSAYAGPPNAAQLRTAPASAHPSLVEEVRRTRHATPSAAVRSTAAARPTP